MNTMRTTLAALALVLIGCNKSAPPEAAFPPSMGKASSATLPNIVDEPTAPSGAIRLLALGDSYTIGQSVDPADRWPVQLVASLRKQGIAVADPTIIARTGWTTAELANALERTKLKERYTLISLLIGVNNQFRGRDVDEYRIQFAALLAKAIELAGGVPDHVLVLSIPDWGVTPMGRKRNPVEIAAAIDRFNTVNREETIRSGAVYVEITGASRQARDDASMIVGDGLHPSRKMYAQWAEASLPFATKALSMATPKN